MGIINPAELDLREESVVKINRTAKVTSRGKRFRFSALVVIGDGKGHVGVGLGKANEVISAIQKGKELAKRNIKKAITDYTKFPVQKYDPDIGIFGMDVNVVLERPGHRVSRRRKQSRRVSASHRVGPDESRAWFSKSYNLKIVGYEEEE